MSTAATNDILVELEARASVTYCGMSEFHRKDEALLRHAVAEIKRLRAQLVGEQKAAAVSVRDVSSHNAALKAQVANHREKIWRGVEQEQWLHARLSKWRNLARARRAQVRQLTREMDDCLEEPRTCSRCECPLDQGRHGPGMCE